LQLRTSNRGSGIRQNFHDFALATQRNSGEFRYETSPSQLQRSTFGCEMGTRSFGGV
jgi:hypothetical protein